MIFRKCFKAAQDGRIVFGRYAAQQIRASSRRAAETGHCLANLMERMRNGKGFAMLSRVLHRFRMLGYRVRYQKKIKFEGTCYLARSANIKLLDGAVRIGKGFTMKSRAYLAVLNGGTLTVGESVAIAQNTMIVCHERVAIGDHCSIAPNVMIYDHDHKFGMNGICPGYHTAPVVIERNCWIGAGVTILRGTHIGEGCVIGAGCVIKGEIPPHSLVTASRELMIKPIENRKS